jgi:methionyl-tRNA formyltransferase
LRVVFAGTPHFADAALRALIAHGFKVVGVLTQPDRPAGRGMKLTPSPVKQTALEHGIPVMQPLSLRLDGKYPDDAKSAHASLAALAPEVMIVAAYGLILPQWTLDLPKAGCVNIHASLLPRWRGAAPIQRAIEAGDTHSGVCLMKMDIGLDTGAVYARESLPIADTMTGGQLHDALAAMGARMLCQHLPAIVAQQLPATAQAEQGVNYAHKLLREHGLLDWSKSAAQLAKQVRGYDPTPGCAFESGGQTYKVWAAQALDVNSGEPAGSALAISEHGVDIACARGTLRITEIQKPGGKRLPVKACWQHLGLNLGLN